MGQELAELLQDGPASTPTVALPSMEGKFFKDWINEIRGSLSVLLLPVTTISHFDRAKPCINRFLSPALIVFWMRVFQNNTSESLLSKSPSPACLVPFSYLTSCIFYLSLFPTPEGYLLQARNIEYFLIPKEQNPWLSASIPHPRPRAIS